MNEYIFDIKASDVKKSNEQLMQLWATFLKEGKIGWQYTPYKNGQENIIFVGFMYVHHLSINYEVNFHVSRNNTVQKVILTRQDNAQITEQEREHLTQVDTERKKLKKQIFYVQVQFSIESFRGIRYFYPFTYQNMTMYCIDDKQYLDFAIKGFCKQQISEEVLELFEKIASFLSTQTNSIIEIQKMCLVNDLVKLKESISSKKQEDENWMDDYPLLDSHFVLPEYAKKLLCKIIEQKNSKDLNILLRASHHFKHSLMLQQKKMQTELIVAQFMSSIEALTELEPYPKTTCPSCSQKIFSIRKRVVALLQKEFPQHMVKMFDDFYDMRSKYLHEGKLRLYREYTGVALPQISQSSKRGCEDYALMFPMINLIEWIGWFIRKKQASTVE